MSTTTNETYSTTKPHWSFEISITLDKPVNKVITKLGRLNNIETYAMLNPVCVEYKEIKRDCVTVPAPSSSSEEEEGLNKARVRELLPSASRAFEPGTMYQRVQFTTLDKSSILFGLMTDTAHQRGTYVWDEETKTGLWETLIVQNPGLGFWTRKVVMFVEEEKGKTTRVVETVEGYCPDQVWIAQKLAKAIAKRNHRNWMAMYPSVFRA